MSVKHLIATAALLALVSSPVLAQTTPAPAKPAAPAATAPASTNMPPMTMAPAATAKVNLNSASAADLDNLPQIGPARAKAIVDARTKSKFKDWNDFVARKIVPSNAQSAIKDKVSF